MAIHNGHPEKYIGLRTLIQDYQPTNTSLLSEEQIETIKLTAAWLPIEQQRLKFTQLQTDQTAIGLEESKEIISSTRPKGLLNVGNTCYMASFI